jgi:hypothetical protein
MPKPIEFDAAAVDRALDAWLKYTSWRGQDYAQVNNLRSTMLAALKAAVTVPNAQ